MPTFRPPRRRLIRIALVAIGGALTVTLIAGGVFAWSLAHTYDTHRHVVDAFPDARTRPAAGTGAAAAAMNILLLGTDVDAADPESPQFVGKREADTVMLLHIPADRSKIYAVSILRNSLVDVPGHGRQAINSAYAFGGVKLQVATVEQLLGVRIDHVVDMSLSGLRDLTDALGGVEITNRTPVTSQGIVFPAGKQTLDGDRAVAYLHAGDFRATGDETRATAQEQYFKGVLRQVLSAKLLLDPAALAASVTVFAPYLSTDDGLDSQTLVALGVSLRDLRSDDLVTVRVADKGVTTLEGVTVVKVDQNRRRILSEALRGDSMFAFSS